MSLLDLRSDTVTLPTPPMKDAMMNAEVGDDIYGEDPTINALENKLAKMFGMEAGLFCASGTMANQIAINVHTQPGDEVICHEYSHIYNYEGGGTAFNSGVNVRLTRGPRGIVRSGEVEALLHDGKDIHPAPIGLIEMENTVNKAGGTCYTLEEIRGLSDLARKARIPFHMDGARFFNASIAMGYSAGEVGPLLDSISICLSKGLGCPVGSVLLGSRDFITRARRIRKRFGGGMRQAGILAAAGIYALDHHIHRLEEDHKMARSIGLWLQELEGVEKVFPVETNIVIFSLKDPKKQNELIEKMRSEGVRFGTLGPNLLRFVTHLDLPENTSDLLYSRMKAFI